MRTKVLDGAITMPKYYIKSGSLELIYSTKNNSFDAAVTALWETNDHDVLDEYFYVDERGMRDYTNADSQTSVIETEEILEAAGWEH